MRVQVILLDETIEETDQTIVFYEKHFNNKYTKLELKLAFDVIKSLFS